MSRSAESDPSHSSCNPLQTFHVIEGKYLRDILDQPRALQSAVDGLPKEAALGDVVRKLADSEFRRVVLTGMGSSFHALYPLHLALSERGIASHWVETAELLLGFSALYKSDSLLVVVSQSGESAEIVQLLQRAGEFGPVIGVTNNHQSCLGTKASTTLLLNCGVESTVSCKSYVNTLAVLHWLRAVLLQGDVEVARQELLEAQREIQKYLTDWREHVDALVALTDGVHGVFVTGRAESMATAGTGGLILKESTRRHAEGMGCAAFRHGPFEMSGPNVLVLVFEGDERSAALNRRLVEDVNRIGGRAVLVSSKNPSAEVFEIPATASALRPIAEILPVQMLSLALAARDGREAGHFEHATKITITA